MRSLPLYLPSQVEAEAAAEAAAEVERLRLARQKAAREAHPDAPFDMVFRSSGKIGIRFERGAPEVMGVTPGTLAAALNEGELDGWLRQGCTLVGVQGASLGLV